MGVSMVPMDPTNEVRQIENENSCFLGEPNVLYIGNFDDNDESEGRKRVDDIISSKY